MLSVFAVLSLPSSLPLELSGVVGVLLSVGVGCAAVLDSWVDVFDAGAEDDAGAELLAGAELEAADDAEL